MFHFHAIHSVKHHLPPNLGCSKNYQLITTTVTNCRQVFLALCWKTTTKILITSSSLSFSSEDSSFSFFSSSSLLDSSDKISGHLVRFAFLVVPVLLRSFLPPLLGVFLDFGNGWETGMCYSSRNTKVSFEMYKYLQIMWKNAKYRGLYVVISKKKKTQTNCTCYFYTISRNS